MIVVSAHPAAASGTDLWIRFPSVFYSNITMFLNNPDYHLHRGEKWISLLSNMMESNKNAAMQILEECSIHHIKTWHKRRAYAAEKCEAKVSLAN